jgi:tRNA G18 (ribose-2'-O)-methylase SpoU
MPQGKRFVLLDNIRSLLNVGSIFRTADGMGFDRVYLTGYSPCPPRHEMSKTALGAETYVDWEYYEDPLVLVDLLKKEGISIVAVECTHQSQNFKDWIPDDSVSYCLILGNETQGVQSSLLSLADKVIHIPMLGKKNSLNVSVASGIIMAHVAKSPKNCFLR